MTAWVSVMGERRYRELVKMAERRYRELVKLTRPRDLEHHEGQILRKGI